MVDVRSVEGHDDPATSVIKVATTRSKPAPREVGQSKSHGAMLALALAAAL